MGEIYAKSISLVKLTDIKLNPKNRNKHPADQIDRLVTILKENGFRRPGTISNRTGFLVCGEGRYLAAKKLGLKEMPIMFQDYTGEADELADAIADNAIDKWASLDQSGIMQDVKGLEADFNLDRLGIKDFRIVDAQIEPQCDEDDAPPVRTETISKPGDLWQLGRHKLLCGDATNLQSIEAMMAGELADCVWTDPPYNVALGMETPEQAKARNRRTDGLVVMNDKMEDADFRQFLTDAFISMAAVTKPGGGIYIAHADSEGYNFRGAARDSGWLIKQCLIWKKSSLVMGRQDYQWIHEPILYGWREGGSHTWLGDRKQTTVLDFNKPSRNGEHPTMKPVELIEYCLLNSVVPGGLVLDLFGGSGSTMIACEKTQRSARLVELDPKYCDVIVARWEKYTGQKASRLNAE